MKFPEDVLQSRALPSPSGEAYEDENGRYHVLNILLFLERVFGTDCSVMCEVPEDAFGHGKVRQVEIGVGKR